MAFVLDYGQKDLALELWLIGASVQQEHRVVMDKGTVIGVANARLVIIVEMITVETTIRKRIILQTVAWTLMRTAG